MALTHARTEGAPGQTAAEQLAQRQVLQAGASPWNKGRTPPPRPDTSKTARCTACGKRFVGTVVPTAGGAFARTAEEHLQAHILDKHTTAKPRSSLKTEDRAAAIELVRTTITSRIGSGELKPGQVLPVSRLTAELGVSRHHADTAVAQLIAEGHLGRIGTVSAYTRIVVR